MSSEFSGHVWESFLTRAPLVNVAREKLLESEWEKKGKEEEEKEEDEEVK